MDTLQWIREWVKVIGAHVTKLQLKLKTRVLYWTSLDLGAPFDTPDVCEMTEHHVISLNITLEVQP